jgi:2-oxoglutarate dehydrogenase E2 component (dihydrolipoamide succinyltransferase)
MGETVDEVVVLEWLVAVGDQVAAGDALLSVETDKVDVEVPAPFAGRVIELVVAPDDEIVTGTVICRLEPV